MTNRTDIKVRYAETDQMGVVYYANYFVWMEIGRTNLLRDMGITYKEIEQKGYFLPVAKAYSKYIAPSYYDDDVAILSTLTVASGSRIRIDYQMYRAENQSICLGFTEHAFLSSETKKLIKIPDFFRNRIQIPENKDDYLTDI